MKEEKLFKMVQNVDDDLICEMMDYIPEAESDKNVCEGVMCSAPEGAGRRFFWRIAVTSAALLALIAAAVLTVSLAGPVPAVVDGPSAGQTETEAAAGDSGISAGIEGTDAEIKTETAPAVSETPVNVVPEKVVNLSMQDIVYTKQYPEIPAPDFDEKYFTEMTSEELYEYYGFYSARQLINEGELIEVPGDNVRRGIYRLPDGSVYDVNTFTYENTESGAFCICGKKFTVTLSKNTVFGQEFDADNAVYENKTGKYSYFYNEETKTFFARKGYEDFGFIILISGKADELSDFDSPENKDFARGYHNGDDPEYWKGVPWEFWLFWHNVGQMNPYIAEARENETAEDF